VPLPNQMDKEITSAINRVFFNQQPQPHIRTMKARRNAKSVIAAVRHQNATAEMGMQYPGTVITAARTVNSGVVDVEENEIRERLKIHAVPLVWYMGKGAEGLQTMGEKFEAENEGIVNPTQVRWLETHRSISERSQNREIAFSSIVFIVKRCKVAQSFIKKGIRWRECGIKSSRSRMQTLTAGVSSAVEGATLRIGAAIIPSVATAQVIARQATTSAMQ